MFYFQTEIFSGFKCEDLLFDIIINWILVIRRWSNSRCRFISFTTADGVSLLKGGWLNIRRYRCNHQSCWSIRWAVCWTPEAGTHYYILSDKREDKQDTRQRRAQKKNSRRESDVLASVSVLILAVKNLRIVNMSVFVMVAHVSLSQNTKMFWVWFDSCDLEATERNIDYTWNLFEVLKSKESQ